MCVCVCVSSALSFGGVHLNAEIEIENLFFNFLVKLTTCPNIMTRKMFK